MIEETLQNETKLYANDLERAGSSGTYINLREVSRRFQLEPGNYLIIPSTSEMDVEAEFLLRIFTEQSVVSR